jgi:L-ribulose-5-phosphate 3-epimerase
MTTLVSCFSNSYGRFGASGAIANLRAAGLEFLELPIRTDGVPSVFGDEPLLTDRSTADDRKRVDDLLAKERISVSSCNITSGNPLEQSVVDVTKRKLDLAAHFGVSVVVGGAGELPDEESRETLYRRLRTIGDHAAALGITYCFETHPGICVHHTGMLQTMRDLDHPHLKLNFDTGNILYFNEHLQCEIALAKVCQYVRHVHLKDHNGVTGEWYFPALGCGGEVDFLRVLQLLRDCGFSGPYSLEIEGIEGEGELPLQTYQERIVESVEHLRNCGYFD